MTQERRKDDKLPEGPLVFTDRNLTAAGLAHLEAEKAAACLVHAKDDVWVGVGSKDALRGLLSEDSANKAAAVDLTSLERYMPHPRLINAMQLSEKGNYVRFVDVGALLSSAAPADEAKPVAHLYQWIGEGADEKTRIVARTLEECGGDIDMYPHVWKRIGALYTRAAPAAQPDEWPTPLDLLAENLDNIAEGWTACMYDAPGETIDIGADLRRSFAKLIDGLKSAATTTSQPDEARDAARYRYLATLMDWSEVERMCWSSAADCAERFKRDLDTYIDGKLATLSPDHAECIARIVAPTSASPSHPDPELQKLECPDCGTDRLKAPCPRMADECAMVADAHLLHPVQQQEQGDELPEPAIRVGNCFPNFADSASENYYTEGQFRAALAQKGK